MALWRWGSWSPPNGEGQACPSPGSPEALHLLSCGCGSPVDVRRYKAASRQAQDMATPASFLFLEPPGFPTWAAAGSRLIPLSPASGTLVWGFLLVITALVTATVRWPEPPSGTSDCRDRNPPLTKHLLCAWHLPCLALSGLLQHMGAFGKFEEASCAEHIVGWVRPQPHSQPQVLVYAEPGQLCVEARALPGQCLI